MKRQASEAFERGDFDEGQVLIGRTKARLARTLAVAPEELRPEIEAELGEVARIGDLGDETGPAGASLMSKVSRESYHRMNRKRGRRFRSQHDDDPT